MNYTGNHSKSLHISVEASLKKLRTSYIDILYVHWWDWTTSVEEIMNALHNLVAQGKVLYLVRCFSHLSFYEAYPHCTIGNLGHTGMDRAQSEPIRERPRKDTILNLPRKMERARSFI